MFRLASIRTVLLAALAPSALWAAAPFPRSGALSLRARVAVTGSVVRLGDLLARAPAPALPDASDAARVLALAPQPGSPRVWTRAQVRDHLAAAGLDPELYRIPPRIVITRQASPIAEKFVLAALETRLGHPVAAASVEYVAPLSAAANPGVVASRVSFDPRRGGLEVLCRAHNDPRLLPFLVFVRLPEAQRAAYRHTAVAALAGRRQQPVLVRPGHPAELDIDGTAFSLHAEVMPLANGRAGDRIHAVSLATHAMLEVEVVGKDRVRVLSAEPGTTRGLSGHAAPDPAPWNAPAAGVHEAWNAR